jgi:hypothetical protein
MSESGDYHEWADGEVRVWINEGGAISIKAADKHGDPVELSEVEASELATVLNKLVSKIR